MIGPIEVDTFFTRLTKERNELHERVGKLRSFVESIPFHKLNKKQRHWLRKQLNCNNSNFGGSSCRDSGFRSNSGGTDSSICIT